MAAPTDCPVQERHPRQPERRDWHLDKTISITHLFSTVSAIISLVVIAMMFNTRLSLVEQTVLHLEASDNKQEAATKDFRAEMRATTTVLNEKLDRVIERMPHK